MREMGYHNLVPKTTPFISSQFCRWEVQVGSMPGSYMLYVKVWLGWALSRSSGGKTCFWADSAVGKFSSYSGRIEGLGPY